MVSFYFAKNDCNILEPAQYNKDDDILYISNAHFLNTNHRRKRKDFLAEYLDYEKHSVANLSNIYPNQK